MHFAPCSRLEVELFHSAEPIQVIGINSAGDVVARAATGTQQGQPEVVVLRAHEIVSAELSGRRGEGFLVGACSFSEAFHGDDDDKERKLRRYTYTGFIDLELRERSDQWGIVLFVQTVDPNPVGTDPAVAAGTSAGITASANMGECRRLRGRDVARSRLQRHLTWKIGKSMRASRPFGFAPHPS